ncbi:MAG TPA: DAK2 domain-containing protein [Acidimicrobiia bacterium]
MTALDRPLERLGPADLRRAVETFRDALRLHQDELNRLNVYPVPDGDTGTNMALTLESVCNELRSAEAMSEVCNALSRGSLMGARGNSGVITSQILRGFAEVFQPREWIGPADLVTAFRRGADAAYDAVLRPVEGTILMVARETAEACEAAAASAGGNGGLSLDALVDAASAAAQRAVERTPELLAALRQAGVVDSGGSGFTLFLAALLHVIDGRPLPEPAVLATTPAAVERHLAGEDIAGLRYEVMYLLDADDTTIGPFRDTWLTIGDSIVVVGGDGIYNCHIHTNDIGGAVEAGIQAGRPHEIRVTDLFDEVAAGEAAAEEADWVREAHGGGRSPGEHEPVTTAVVAVGVGEGVRRLLCSLGVQEVVAGGQSMNPSTAQILEAVEATNADAVIVLPNNKNIIAVAQQVDSLTEKHVEVVATTSVIEALAALVAYDPDEEIGPNTAAFTEAVGRVRSGEVTQAVRDSSAECGEIRQGDWLAIARVGGIVAAKPSTSAACAALLDELVDDDSEIVTVVVGAEARTADSERIKEHLKLAHPHVDVEFHEGGQPLYPYLVGVE